MAYLEKHRNWQLVTQRFRTPFAEIDLVFATPYGFALIEVKSLSGQEWSSFRLTRSQAGRLRRAHLWFSEKKPTSLHLALVHQTEVLVIDENFGV